MASYLHSDGYGNPAIPCFQWFRVALRGRVVKIDSVRTVFFTLLTGAILAGSASAQSELNFPTLSGASSYFSLTNPSDAIAEVEFSLLDLEGALVAAPLNPVRYRIPAGGNLSMPAADVFAASVPASGQAWVRIASPTSGVGGALFDTDSVSTFEGTVPAAVFQDQIVAIPDRGQDAVRHLRVVNPSDTMASINVTIFNADGSSVAATSATLAANGGAEIDLDTLTGNASGPLSARLSSSVSVAAEVRVIASGAELRVTGQPASTGGSASRIAPHVVFGGGFDSTLILSNPTGQSVNVTVTLSGQDGGPAHVAYTAAQSQTVTIASNATVSLGTLELTGLAMPADANGWLQVDSPNVSLGATLIVSNGESASAYPLQNAGFRGAHYPHLADAAYRVGSLALTNAGETGAEVEIVLVAPDGVHVATADQTVAADSQTIAVISEMFNSRALSRAGWIGVVSNVDIQSAAILAHSAGAYLSIVEPLALPSAIDFTRVATRPTLEPLITLGELRPGNRVTFRTNVDDPSVVFVFGEDFIVSPLFLVFSRVGFNLPNLEPGIVDVRLRTVNGRESEPVSLLVGPFDVVPTIREVEGRAFYQKILSTSEGLDLESSVAVPIGGARVEVYNELTRDLFSVATTHDDGSYRVRVPPPETDGYGIRVLSMERHGGVMVADNTDGGAIYSIGESLGEAPPSLLIPTDDDRISGAFNIFDVMRRANDFIWALDPTLELPYITIFWSQSNTRTAGDPATGNVGGTYFDPASNTAFVLGDRQVDSDEFDDSVLLHEYAHILAAQLSRDDSVGEAHVIGDVLDPRVAWSEGWANFFAGWVLGDATYRDTYDPDGSSTLEYDLDVNLVAGDGGGYWSEFTVHSLLWDLVDSGGASDDDAVDLDFGPIWQAFLELGQDAFVYAVTFLDRLTAIEGVDVGSVEQLARSRTIDYQASADPSVSTPFPRSVAGNVAVTGEVDSLSPGRSNLAQSAHLYSFDFGGGAVSIRLAITGLGPAANASANDLDLFLMDSDGQPLARSDRGLNGQSELISTMLPVGRYVVEVRSFYTLAETGATVFNSGSYQLLVSFPIL